MLLLLLLSSLMESRTLAWHWQNVCLALLSECLYSEELCTLTSCNCTALKHARQRLQMQKMVCVGTEEEAISLFDEFFCTNRQLSSWSSDSNIRAHIWQSVLHLPADVKHITSWWIRELVIGAEKSSLPRSSAWFLLHIMWRARSFRKCSITFHHFSWERWCWPWETSFRWSHETDRDHLQLLNFWQMILHGDNPFHAPASGRLEVIMGARLSMVLCTSSTLDLTAAETKELRARRRRLQKTKMQMCHLGLQTVLTQYPLTMWLSRLWCFEMSWGMFEYCSFTIVCWFSLPFQVPVTHAEQVSGH